MTYCTPRAVQEQILKRKLAASGCAVTLNKDRPSPRRAGPYSLTCRTTSSCTSSATAPPAASSRWRRRRVRCWNCFGRRRGTSSKLCGAVACARAGRARSRRSARSATTSGASGSGRARPRGRSTGVLYEEGRRGRYRERGCARRGRARGTGLYRCRRDFGESLAGMRKATPSLAPVNFFGGNRRRFASGRSKIWNPMSQGRGRQSRNSWEIA